VFGLVVLGSLTLPATEPARAATTGATATATVAAAGETLPLGVLRLEGRADPCGAFSCQRFVVSCPGVSEDESGVYRFAPHAGAARGLVAFFSGGFGTDYWSEDDPGALRFLDQLRGDGFDVVEVRWGSWLRAPAGEQTGPARLACRPATVIRWVHDNLYARLGLTPSAGRCGFCVTGNSGGASQVSYALSHYGLERILAGVFPTGGPPHTALDAACLARPGEEHLSYQGTAAVGIIDRSYGFTRGGPCQRRDPAFEPFWERDSIDIGGSDYLHPTRIHFLVGSRDRGIHPHAQVYADRLRAAGSRPVLQVVEGLGHPIAPSPEGRAALRNALLG
jgi:hypothetical protein